MIRTPLTNKVRTPVAIAIRTPVINKMAALLFAGLINRGLRLTPNKYGAAGKVVRYGT